MEPKSVDRPTPGWGLIRALTGVAGRLRRAEAPPQRRQPVPRAYVVRKRSLPHTFTQQDWERALEYWGYRCAVCGRPRGLWHTLAADHWIPLTHQDCPGTVATNIIPLCHGEGGCNNSKGKKMPDAWLEERLGAKQGFQKGVEIDAYFLWLKDQLTERLGCPRCGEPVLYSAADDIWLCTYCDAEWTSEDARRFTQCPQCQCWMITPDGTAEAYYCPRCRVEWSEIPPPENCPGCGKGILEWAYDPAGPVCGYWRCTRCRGEWVFEYEEPD
jgi:ribosomal protein L37AE/L43A